MRATSQDGHADVITLANCSAAVTVHKNLGNGSFQVLPRYEVASLSDAVESADIDNDGDIDIVVNGEVDIIFDNLTTNKRPIRYCGGGPKDVRRVVKAAVEGCESINHLAAGDEIVKAVTLEKLHAE